MQLAARPCIAAAAALATGSIIVGTSVMTPSLPDIHLPAIHLTAVESILDTLSQDELTFGPNLVGQEVAGNTSLFNGEQQFEQALFPLFKNFADTTNPATGGSILNGTLNRLFNVDNMFVGANEQSLNGLLGVSSNPGVANPFDITGGLLTGFPNHTFDTGDIGGLEGALGNGLFANGDFVGLLNDQFGLQLPGPTNADFSALQTAMTTFNQSLVNDEVAFNHNLVAQQVAMEMAAFSGQDNAFNGTVDRLFNVNNMFLDANEQSLNGLLGVSYQGYDPGAITTSLLQGSCAQVFNCGDIGGLMGVFDQNLALLADMTGLQASDITSAFAKPFDATAFSDALTHLFDTGAFSGLGADLTPVFGDLSTIVTSFF